MSLANYQRYGNEYFSGSDVYISFNNQILDEIVYIDFIVEEPITPIWGYASYTFDAVSRGARIVRGRFRVNFTESAYLYTKMMELNADTYSAKTAKKTVSNKTWFNNPDNLTSEDIVAMLSSGSEDKLINLMNSNESKIWGTDNEDESQKKYNDSHFAYGLNNELRDNGFDILLSYGDEEFYPSSVDTEAIPGTIEVINGVHIYSCSKIIAPSGEAVFEEYAFIGQDMNNVVGKIKK